MCLESKFDKKIPMGSVPNCQKEIPARHAIRWFKCKLIRWFKCKLKPPKKRCQNDVKMSKMSKRSQIVRKMSNCQKVKHLDCAGGFHMYFVLLHDITPIGHTHKGYLK